VEFNRGCDNLPLTPQGPFNKECEIAFTVLDLQAYRGKDSGLHGMELSRFRLNFDFQVTLETVVGSNGRDLYGKVQ
jgi:hypothetical protein